MTVAMPRDRKRRDPRGMTSLDSAEPVDCVAGFTLVADTNAEPRCSQVLITISCWSQPVERVFQHFAGHVSAPLYDATPQRASLKDDFLFVTDEQPQSNVIT